MGRFWVSKDDFAELQSLFELQKGGFSAAVKGEAFRLHWFTDIYISSFLMLLRLITGKHQTVSLSIKAD